MTAVTSTCCNGTRHWDYLLSMRSAQRLRGLRFRYNDHPARDIWGYPVRSGSFLLALVGPGSRGFCRASLGGLRLFATSLLSVVIALARQI